MKYVALLRGINVGRSSKVEMRRLKGCFEGVGLKSVRTYINSGNVLFDTGAKDRKRLVKRIERAIEDEFGFRVPLVLRTPAELVRVTKAVPRTWVTDQRMRCDVMFLWPEADSRSVIRKVPVQKEFEDVKYVVGALIWRIDRADVGKSKVSKVIGSDLYKSLTIRNINTVRKLEELMRG
ncbi:MAG: DUF1697 domain-containing protein [Actinobacteria bacterium]|nr:MAG: DUF1697 domain-containing protein [Actinomycetota bacterium]